MSFDSTRRYRISINNIRELLANDGYQREGTGPVPRCEALMRAIEDAARYDHINLLKELVAEGGDATKCADPLIAACELGNLHIVRYLCDLGANVNGRGRQGETPLMAAAAGGELDVVRFLLSRGADSTMHDTETDSKDALGWAKIGFAKVNWPTGMSEAIRLQFEEIILLLTDIKSKPDKRVSPN